MPGERSYGLGNPNTEGDQRIRQPRRDPGQSRQAPPAREPRETRQQAEYLDIHIQQGLIDAHIRVKPQHWETFLDVVICGREEMIFQARFPQGEDDIKIHGDQPCRWKARAADMSRKLPLYAAIPVEEIRKLRISQASKKAS